ncbi:MAG: OsmC family protein [Phycisphaerales bacterium]
MRMKDLSSRCAISTTLREPYESLVTVKGEVEHRFTSDAHPSDGGQGKGPTPHELLEASLAGCKSITVQMYAQRKGWPLESVTVRVRHEHRAKEGSDDKAHHFDVQVELTGDLTDEQRTRLHEIAGRCPVHKILEQETVFVSELVD